MGSQSNFETRTFPRLKRSSVVPTVTTIERRQKGNDVAKRKDRYVVGYPQRGTAIFGGEMYIFPMTQKQAERRAKSKPELEVLGLVPVKPKRVEKGGGKE